MTGNYEWADDMSYASNATLMGSTDCTDASWDGITTTHVFRCCSNLE